MSNVSKLVHGGEWVSVRNMMNKNFPANDPCSICHRLSCSPVWYSIKSGEVRCKKCYNPRLVRHSVCS